MNQGTSSPDPRLIEQRAYQIWEDEGRPEGRQEDHWYRAEHELSNGRAVAGHESGRNHAVAQRASANGRAVVEHQSGNAAAIEPARKERPARKTRSKARR